MINAASIAIVLSWLAPAQDAPVSVTVLPVILEAVPAEVTADAIEEVILTSVQKAGSFQVTGRSDIIAILDQRAREQLLGCNDEFCMTELAGALGADRMVSTSVSLIDAKWLITAKLIVSESTAVVARANKIVEGDRSVLLKAIPVVIGELFGVTIERLGVMVQKSPSADSILNAHVDAGGFLSYGPAIAVEVGSKLAGLARARFMNLGIATHIGAYDAFHGERFSFGVGAGVGGRYYLGYTGNMRGFYVGGAGEYWYTRVKDVDFDRELYITHGLLVALEGGHRWVFFDSFLLSLGGQIGYFKVLDQSTEDLSDGEDLILYEASGQDSPSVSVEVAVGYFF